MPQRRGIDRRTEGEVFDRPTLMVLHRMLTHGLLKSLDFPVATGKEANVFRGTTPRGGYVAVKIYRINTATFKHVLKYIQGDDRFQGVAGDKRGLVHAWCQKEFRNLARMRDAGVSVPEPIKAVQNVLVMEYLGKKLGPWPSLKAATPIPEPEKLRDQCVTDYLAGYNKAGLIHGDWSEYNVMLENSDSPPSEHRARIIDVGQAVLWNHPMSGEFLSRDLKNMCTFFTRQGADLKLSDVRAELVDHQADPVGDAAREKHETDRDAEWEDEDA